MRHYGFSTGALARGDFRAALEMLRGHATEAIELSALRDHELPALMAALPELDLSGYSYVSIHAPSCYTSAQQERQVARALEACIVRGIHIVLHPDSLHDLSCWHDFGSLICIENNDKRKVGRTVAELEPTFERLPKASWCLDLGHARQVDSSLMETWRMLREFGSKLREIHLSELNARCGHERLSMNTVWAVRELAHLIPEVPVILESQVEASEIAAELEMARACFEREALVAGQLAAG
jgi:hypothetical protein